MQASHPQVSSAKIPSVFLQIKRSAPKGIAGPSCSLKLNNPSGQVLLETPALSYVFLLNGFPFVHDLDDIRKRPEPIRYASFHRWCNLQRLVNPHEVVPRRIKRDHVTVILELLRESIG
jgi:hypothetical protein